MCAGPTYADAVRDVHVRLQDEDPQAKEPGVRGKLRKMYGSLDADGGENTMHRFGREEAFLEARLLRTTSLTKTCKPASWRTVTTF